MAFIWFPTNPEVQYEEIVKHGHIINPGGSPKWGDRNLGLRDATIIMNKKLRPNKRASISYNPLIKNSSLVTSDVLESIASTIKSIYDGADDNVNGYAYFESIHKAKYDSVNYSSDDTGNKSSFDSSHYSADEATKTVCLNEGIPGGGCPAHYINEVSPHYNSNVTDNTSTCSNDHSVYLLKYSGPPPYISEMCFLNLTLANGDFWTGAIATGPGSWNSGLPEIVDQCAIVHLSNFWELCINHAPDTEGCTAYLADDDAVHYNLYKTHINTCGTVYGTHHMYLTTASYDSNYAGDLSSHDYNDNGNVRDSH